MRVLLLILCLATAAHAQTTDWLAEASAAREALNSAPTVENQRRAVEACANLAAQWENEGRDAESLELVAHVLSPAADSTNPTARKILRNLQAKPLSPAVKGRLDRILSWILPTQDTDRRSLEREYRLHLSASPQWAATKLRLSDEIAGSDSYGIVASTVLRQREIVEVPVRQWMEKMIIPEVDFENTPLEVAVDFFRQKSIELGGNPLPLIPRQPGEPAPSILPEGEVRKLPITLRLTNASLWDGLRWTAAQANLKVRITERGAILVPIAEKDPELFYFALRLPPGMLEPWPQNGPLPPVFRAWPDGSQFAFDSSAGFLFLRTTLAEAQRYENSVWIQAEAFPASGDTTLPVDPDQQAENALRAKLKSIRIPEVVFENTPFSMALGTLRELSVKHDPEKIGVYLVCRSQRDKVMETPITLRLKDISLAEAVRYTGDVARLGSWEEGASVIFDLPTPGGGHDLLTRTFRVSPSHFRGEETAIQILTTHGINPGEGGAAILSRQTSQLVVRAGWSEMLAIEKFLAGPPPNPRVSLLAAWPLALPPVPSLNVRQIWVPEKDLGAVLAKHPKAVLLNRQQFEQLLRDAAQPAEAKPPIPALIKNVRLEGEIRGEAATVRALFEVESFTDDWAEVPLIGDPGRFAEAKVDGESAFRILPTNEMRSVLMVKGKGVHNIELNAILPIEKQEKAEGVQLTIPHPGGATTRLTLKLPAGAVLEESIAAQPQADGVTAFTFPADGEPLTLRWTSRDAQALSGVAVHQICRFIHHLDATRVHADLGMRLEAHLRELPNPIEFPLPAGAQVLNVESKALAGWTVAENKLVVRRIETATHQMDLRILLDAAALTPEQNEAALNLPVLQAEGVTRAEGSLALIGDEGVRVRAVSVSPLMTASLEQIEPSLVEQAGFVTGFDFPALQGAAPQVTLRRADSLVHAALDTKIRIARDGIHQERTLDVQPREGRVFSSKLTLPVGETLVDVNSAQMADWTQAASEITIVWKEPVAPGARAQAVVRTRVNPPDWHNLAAEPVHLGFESAKADVDVISGYVAVESDAAYQVETVSATGLETRDGRRTPVTGKLAWFRLSDYNLALKVSRRQPELEAAVTAYALPLSSTLEIEGSLLINIRHAPIRSLDLELPQTMANRFKAEAPFLSEQSVNLTTGVVTLRFRQELEGAREIRWRMSLPLSSQGTNAERRFQAAIPTIKIPLAKRLTGSWMVEANTDTELSLEPRGLDPLGTLSLPAVAGYVPKHRVIAAYSYRGSDYALTIRGTRHAAGNVAATVIESLAVDSLISTSGLDRHQVELTVKSSGDQFLDVALPPGAGLWTLMVDYAPVKPARGAADVVRIALPNRGEPVNARLVFETRSEPWKERGRREMPKLGFAPGIPILKTRWQVHVPDGFSYVDFDTNLRAEFAAAHSKVLLGALWEELAGKPPVLVSRPGLTASGTPQTPLDRAREAAYMADSAAATGQWKSAAMYYRGALNWIAEMPGSEGLKRKYRDQTAHAMAQFAREKMDSQAYGEALELAADILSPAFAPREGVAVQLLADMGPLPLAPHHRARLERIQASLAAAAPLLSSGQMMEAERLYRQRLLASEALARTGLTIPEKALATSSFGLIAFQQAVAIDPAAQSVGERLKQIMIPRVEFEDTPALEAYQFLESKLGGIKINLPPAQLMVEPDQPTVPRKVTLLLSDVSAAEALRYTTEMLRMKFRVTADGVEILSMMQSTDDLLWYAFRLPPSIVDAWTNSPEGQMADPFAFLPSDQASSRRGADPFAALPADGTENAAPGGASTPREAMEMQGITFGPGSIDEWDPAANLLLVRNTESQAELIEGWLSYAPEMEDYASGDAFDDLPNDSGGGGALHVPNAENAIQQLGERMRRIIIPEIELENTPLKEAVATLVRLSRENDPAKLGVTIVLNQPTPEMEARPITLRLTTVTLWDAIRYTTEMARLKFKVSPHVVEVMLLTEQTDDLVTRTFRVPPSFLASSDETPQQAPSSTENPRAILESSGMTFGPGSNVIYSKQTNQLIVRATASQMELIEAYLMSLRSIDPNEAALLTQLPILAMAEQPGLMPMDFELPQSGRTLAFEGFYAPAGLAFDYRRWESQIWRAWWLVALGAVAFWFLAGRRPIYRGVWGILLLTFIPLLVSGLGTPDLTAFANNILLGWLLAMALIVLWNTLNFLQRLRRPRLT